jgi:hypothetical protein
MLIKKTVVRKKNKEKFNDIERLFSVCNETGIYKVGKNTIVRIKKLIVNGVWLLQAYKK